MTSVMICERDSQVKDLRIALGGQYGKILPARGHIQTLKEPHEVREDWTEWSSELLWTDEFFLLTPVHDTKSLLPAMRSEIAHADQVIIATDCDWEGQLIGDKILDFLGYQGSTFRAIFTAQDPKTSGRHLRSWSRMTTTRVAMRPVRPDKKFLNTKIAFLVAAMLFSIA